MGNISRESNSVNNFNALVQYGESIKHNQSSNLGVEKLKSGESTLKVNSAWQNIKGVFSQKKAIEERSQLVSSAVWQGKKEYEENLQDFATKRQNLPARFEAPRLPVDRENVVHACKSEVEMLKKMREDVISAKLATDRFAPEQSQTLAVLIQQCDQEIAARKEMLHFYRNIKPDEELIKYVTRVNVTVNVSRLVIFENALDVNAHSSNIKEDDKKRLNDAFKELVKNGNYDQLRQALIDCETTEKSNTQFVKENDERIQLLEKKLDTKSKWFNLELYDYKNQLEGLSSIREGYADELKTAKTEIDKQRLLKQIEQENEHLETLQKELQEKVADAETTQLIATTTQLIEEYTQEIALRKNLMQL